VSDVEKGESFLVGLDEAMALVSRTFAPLEAVQAGLADAPGHVLAADVVCREGHPPFDRSAMDGYAVRAADLPRPGASLALARTVKAGQRAPGPLAEGSCVKIMTGAPLPKGADAVVMKEETKEEGERVVFLRPASPRQNIRFRGEDIAEGKVAAPAGSLVTPAVQGVCALCGAALVRVVRRPVVAIVTTGDEIVSPETPVPPFGAIRNSSGPMLESLCARAGCEARFLGVAPDRPEAIREAVGEGLGSDLVLVTGGVSVGEFDFVTDALLQLGLEHVFRKVRLKPGRPVQLAAGPRGKAFGLPGNPVSTLTSFVLFVRPAIRRMRGLVPAWRMMDGVLAKDVAPDPHRARAVLCASAQREGRFVLTPVPFNGSGDLVGASRADAIALVGAGAAGVGREVRFVFVDEER